MINYQEALSIILNNIPVSETFQIPTKESFGFVLGEDVFLGRDYPDIGLSAIDGFALNGIDQTEFRVVGEIAAGGMPDFKLQPGECAAVMTGAPIPEGTESVIRIEDCQIESGVVKTQKDVSPGELINETGSESRKGNLIAAKGAVINHSLYPALFYAGIPQIKVYRKPKIGMLLTGDELRDVDQQPAPGQVFNTNCYTLESFVKSLNLELCLQIQAKDDLDATRVAFAELGEKCDIVVSSGGVSMGQYDFVKKIFKEHTFEVLIEKTRIKPGSPLMVAAVDDKIYFGMPGYPSAFLTNCLVYLVPALKKAAGRVDYQSKPVKARLISPLKSRTGRRQFNRVRLELKNGEWLATASDSQKTSHFLNVATVNGLAILDEETGDLNPGETVGCLQFALELV